MFLIMYLMIFVDLFFLADIICAMKTEVLPLEIGTMGTIPCDHMESDPEVRLVQWYKSKRTDTFVNGDPSLAWYQNGTRGSLPNYHMENTTFSLVIDKATKENEGLYKCIVLRGDLFEETNYFTLTVTYALPRKDPEITLDLTLNHVKCTVEHVQSLIYPVFNFDYIHASTETYAVLNEDGTYTTSVSCKVPQNKSALRVECSFFFFHYQRVASLDLRDVTTDSLIEDKTTSLSPMSTSVTFEGDLLGPTVYVIATGATIGVLGVIILLMFIMMTTTKRVCQSGVINLKEAEGSKEQMIQRRPKVTA